MTQGYVLAHALPLERARSSGWMIPSVWGVWAGQKKRSNVPDRWRWAVLARRTPSGAGAGPGRGERVAKAGVRVGWGVGGSARRARPDVRERRARRRGGGWRRRDGAVGGCVVALSEQQQLPDWATPSNGQPSIRCRTAGNVLARPSVTKQTSQGAPSPVVSSRTICHTSACSHAPAGHLAMRILRNLTRLDTADVHAALRGCARPLTPFDMNRSSAQNQIHPGDQIYRTRMVPPFRRSGPLS